MARRHIMTTLLAATLLNIAAPARADETCLGDPLVGSACAYDVDEHHEGCWTHNGTSGCYEHTGHRRGANADLAGSHVEASNEQGTGGGRYGNATCERSYHGSSNVQRVGAYAAGVWLGAENADHAWGGASSGCGQDERYEGTFRGIRFWGGGEGHSMGGGVGEWSYVYRGVYTWCYDQTGGYLYHHAPDGSSDQAGAYHNDPCQP